MRIATLAAGAALMTLAAGCTTYGDRPHDGRRSGYSNYDWNRPDPSYGGYDAARYHRSGRQYGERRLTRNDRIYRGRDGRYYCRHSDGTTGLIVGGVAGGVLGNIIAPGGSETLGTLIGAAAGAAIGNAIERGEVKCD
jgi:hypothetical protein